VARDFVRLKLRLIRNGLRSIQYAILFAIGASGAAMLALFGFVLLATLRGDPIASNLTLVLFAFITMMWTVVPLLGFGTDETLDPQRLALLPLARGRLVRGLLAAALIGIAPVATAAALAGAVFGLAHNGTEVALIVAAIAGTILLCVVASRTLIALLAPLLRSRRGRDLLLMSIVLAAFVPQSFRLFGRRSGEELRETIDQIASRVRFTPFGWGGYAAAAAGEGDVVGSIAALLALALLIGVLLWAWSIAIPRAMTSADLATETRPPDARSRRRAALFPRALPFWPRTHAGAVAMKELKYYVRDPRRRGPLFAAMIVPALFLFETLRDAPARPAVSTLLALVALLPASGLTLNQFGLDGAALWSTVAAGNDPEADLTGKNLATAVIVIPLVMLPALTTAAISGGWHYLPITLGLVPGMLGVILAVGNLVSVWAPYALPDRHNPLASNPGQGCVGGLAALTAIVVDALVLAPVGVLTAVALTVLPLPAATVLCVTVTGVFGAVAWLAGRRVAARRLAGRMPELLDAVSPRHAG
jgi:ABC-2 type transport system permease protein